jgi:hypothetical protein
MIRKAAASADVSAPRNEPRDPSASLADDPGRTWSPDVEARVIVRVRAGNPGRRLRPLRACIVCDLATDVLRDASISSMRARELRSPEIVGIATDECSLDQPAVAESAATAEVRAQAFTAAADPADASRRVADHQRMGGDVRGHHGTRADERVLADLDSADDGGVGAESRPPPHAGRQDRVGLLAGRSWPQNVGEGRVWTDEDTFLELDPVPHLSAVLDRDSVADASPGLDEAVATDVAVASHDGSRHHLCERPDTCSRADRAALADSQVVYEDFRVRRRVTSLCAMPARF